MSRELRIKKVGKNPKKCRKETRLQAQSKRLAALLVAATVTETAAIVAQDKLKKANRKLPPIPRISFLPDFSAGASAANVAAKLRGSVRDAGPRRQG